MERYCQLTLEYNGYHVKRNTMSIGIEDLMAFNRFHYLLIQCKNTKRGEKSMNKDEIKILRKHAEDLYAIPIYLYKDGRNRFVWLDVRYNDRFDAGLSPYTKEWYRERMKMREMLRKMKKKNVNDYNKYVLKNWEKVCRYIC